MKVPAETIAQLASAIAPLDTAVRRDAYRRGYFARSDKVKDLDRRYRWDLYWEARFTVPYTGGVNDTHIDTALRSIIVPLGTAEVTS